MFPDAAGEMKTYKLNHGAHHMLESGEFFHQVQSVCGKPGSQGRSNGSESTRVSSYSRLFALLLALLGVIVRCRAVTNGDDGSRSTPATRLVACSFTTDKTQCHDPAYS